MNSVLNIVRKGGGGMHQLQHQTHIFLSRLHADLNVECVYYNTVKRFGLLQPYFGHLSCISFVCMNT